MLQVTLLANYLQTESGFTNNLQYNIIASITPQFIKNITFALSECKKQAAALKCIKTFDRLIC